MTSALYSYTSWQELSSTPYTYIQLYYLTGTVVYPPTHTYSYIYKNCPLTYNTYGTDLMQHRTHVRVLGYHSQSARTQSRVSFNGLELGLELELERKLKRAVRQTKNDNKGAYCYRL